MSVRKGIQVTHTGYVFCAALILLSVKKTTHIFHYKSGILLILTIRQRLFLFGYTYVCKWTESHGETTAEMDHMIEVTMRSSVSRGACSSSPALCALTGGHSSCASPAKDPPQPRPHAYPLKNKNKIALQSFFDASVDRMRKKSCRTKTQTWEKSSEMVKQERGWMRRGVFFLFSLVDEGERVVPERA